MTKKPYLVEIEGVKCPPFFSRECFESALRFKPKLDDIFVVTYPKCGTTWMQTIVLNILRRGEPLEQPRDFFLASPFLDQLGAEDSEKMMIRPGAYKTHLPFAKVPWSDDAKYIYVARNPKDCAVSFYHHMRQIPGYEFSEATFDEFIDLFITGNLEFNDYFNHLLPWYNERKRPNVFFTTYEEMKENLNNVVLKVAAFIGTEEEKYLQDNTGVLEKILHSCSFEEMKFINIILNSLYQDTDKILADPKTPKGRKHIIAYNAKLPTGIKRKINFIRKGKVGDWKTVFTQDNNEKMNKRIETMTQSSDVMRLWNDIL